MIRDLNKIFIWNCRGGANKAFLRVCKNYIRMFHPKIFIVLETRINP